MQTWPQPVKLTETGPMFRYDRPQAGRYRQFWQFDIEAIGDAGPAIDAEIIELGLRFYRDAGLAGVEVHLNSIGDGDLPAGLRRGADRVLRGDIATSCRALERERLERNVLRLLDSHDPAMAALNAAAPKITDRLCDACAEHFAERPGAPRRARRAVPARTRASSAASTTTRGPRSSSTSPGARASSRRSAAAGATTASSSCSAGGRRPASGSGSASIGSSSPSTETGVDRRAGTGPGRGRRRRRPRRHGRPAAVATDLRAAGIAARAELGRRKLGKQLEAASRDQAHFAVIVGDELADGEVGLRDLPAGTQKLVALADLAREIERSARRRIATGARPTKAVRARADAIDGRRPCGPRSAMTTPLEDIRCRPLDPHGLPASASVDRSPPPP